jgi:hypothetical protein
MYHFSDISYLSKAKLGPRFEVFVQVPLAKAFHACRGNSISLAQEFSLHLCSFHSLPSFK